jgi:hypothetical protein
MQLNAQQKIHHGTFCDDVYRALMLKIIAGSSNWKRAASSNTCVAHATFIRSKVTPSQLRTQVLEDNCGAG